MLELHPQLLEVDGQTRLGAFVQAIGARKGQEDVRDILEHLLTSKGVTTSS